MLKPWCHACSCNKSHLTPYPTCVDSYQKQSNPRSANRHLPVRHGRGFVCDLVSQVLTFDYLGALAVSLAFPLVLVELDPAMTALFSKQPMLTQLNTAALQARKSVRLRL